MVRTASKWDNFRVKPSYPTGGLDWLERLEEANDKTRDQPAKVRFRILVVGAGLGGLASSVALARTGHDVTVLEAAPVLGEVGAGIQVSPNVCKHLFRWGLEKYLPKHIVYPEEVNSRRWQNGKIIGKLALRPEMMERYGYPYFQAHRADLHKALHNLALEYKVKIRTDCEVVDYNFDEPSLVLKSGETCTADFIVAADGIKSLGRQKLAKEVGSPASISGFAAFRATISGEGVKNDPDLRWLIERKTQNIWIGPEQHIVSYFVQDFDLMNFVMVHPESRDPSQWDSRTYKEEMLAAFKGWDPILMKLLSLIEKPTKWPLIMVSPLQKWAADSSRFLIVGDAAHASMPWMAQGAAQAIEDAAALAEAFRLLPEPSKECPLSTTMPLVLDAYQKSRIPRTTSMSEAALLNGYLWHQPDGEFQEARDAASRPEVEGRHFIASPTQWTDPACQRWTYGFDAIRDVREKLQEVLKGKNVRFPELDARERISAWSKL